MNLESVTCARHQAPATGLCPRCGSFVCGECGATNACLSCLDAMLPDPARHSKVKRLGSISVGAFFAGMFVPALLRDRVPELFFLFWFVGALILGVATGIVALVQWKRARGEGALYRAWIGVLLNAFMFIAIFGISLWSFLRS